MRQAIQQSGVEAEVQGHYLFFTLRITDQDLAAKALPERERG
jgi:hypothetical protein